MKIELRQGKLKAKYLARAFASDFVIKRGFPPRLIERRWSENGSF